MRPFTAATIIRAAGFALALALMPAGPSSVLAETAQPAHQLKIGNAAPSAILSMFISPSEAEYWDQDLLGSEVLEPGGLMTWQIAAADISPSGLYDVSVVFIDGTVVERFELNLSTAAALLVEIESLTVGCRPILPQLPRTCTVAATLL